MIMKYTIRLVLAISVIAFLLFYSNSDREMVANIYLGLLLIIIVLALLLVVASSSDIYLKAKGLVDIFIACIVCIFILLVFIPLSLYLINHF